MKFQDAQKEILKTLSSKDFYERIKEEDPNMVKFIPTFREINRLGFLTLNSQAGHQTKGRKSYTTGKPYKISERAYMDGFLKEDHAERFLKEIALTTDKIAIYISACKDPNIPSKFDIPLTITESDGKTEVNTHMSTAIPETVLAHFRKQVHLNKSEKAVYIFCLDPIWNRPASRKDGLFSEILQALRNTT